MASLAIKNAFIFHFSSYTAWHFLIHAENRKTFTEYNWIKINTPTAQPKIQIQIHIQDLCTQILKSISSVAGNGYVYKML